MAVEDLPDDPFEMPTTGDDGTIICAFGKKKSGKSYFARRLWNAWPLDALGIDVNGDIGAGDDADRLHELGNKFPIRHGFNGREYRKVVYRADPGSASYVDDLDRAIGMALKPSDNRTLLWIDEIGEVSQGRRPKGNLRRLLMQSRHYGPCSALLCGPRPTDIDKLCYLQADGIAIFELPDYEDREKMARLCKLRTVDEFDQLWQANANRWGAHSFLYWHAASSTLLACPPLPTPGR